MQCTAASLHPGYCRHLSGLSLPCFQAASEARAKGAALEAQRAYLQETLEENTALVRSVQDLSSKVQSAKAIHESMEIQNQK